VMMGIQVYTIDFKSSNLAKSLIQKLGININNIIFINKKSSQIKLADLPTFDLIFIDGGHDYKSVKNDYNIARKVCKKGFVVFDDFRNKHYGVKKFIKEIKQNKLLVNSDGWIYKNILIKKANDGDGLRNGKETKSGQVIIPIETDLI